MVSKMSSKYQIRPLDEQVNKTEPKTIPKPPFSYSPKGAGKTTLILNRLLKPVFFYKGVFNKVYFISPTSKLDAKIETLKTTNGITTPNIKLWNIMKKKKDNFTDPLQAPDKIPEEARKGIMTEDCFLEEVNMNWLGDLLKSQKYVIENYGKQMPKKGY